MYTNPENNRTLDEAYEAKFEKILDEFSAFQYDFAEAQAFAILEDAYGDDIYTEVK